MCGRYALSAPVQRIIEHFAVREWFENESWAPRYNIAPSQPMLIIRPNAADERAAAHVSWGLIPHWTKDVKTARRPINVRSETVDQKPSFKAAFRHRRCLIPADAFYEWQAPGATPSAKIPHAVRMADESLFAFAGLWEHWQSPDGSELETAAILTTNANLALKSILHLCSH